MFDYLKPMGKREGCATSTMPPITKTPWRTWTLPIAS